MAFMSLSRMGLWKVLLTCGKGSNPMGVGGGPGFLSRRYSLKQKLSISCQMQRFMLNNYRGVLHAVWEPKTCNYPKGGQLFSVQEVGQVTPLSKEPLLFISQGPLSSSTWAPAGSLVWTQLTGAKTPPSSARPGSPASGVQRDK